MNLHCKHFFSAISQTTSPCIKAPGHDPEPISEVKVTKAIVKSPTNRVSSSGVAGCDFNTFSRRLESVSMVIRGGRGCGRTVQGNRAHVI